MSCSVDGCAQKHRCKGYCAVHYERVRKTGSVADPPSPKDGCSIDGCKRPHRARGWCALHYYRWKRLGDANWQPTQRTDITYSAAHLRVIAARGRADAHACLDCGSPAAEWSYTHRDPNELYAPDGRPYSLDIQQYEPRCRNCHRNLDAAKTPECSKDACTDPAKARGLCNKHYQRARLSRVTAVL
ncbi:hypothetical protein SD37_11630 [Amycolatopsis orientalis]|uniref:HNH endonuclease n=1 Tax=Amycolatopsis orientalis TaxID=31958 RepID=A0A193BVN1_AMYOR|nr:hypothetical protein [Amycolatopsis orientalis]ANN16228.1 hypothetical protein SD37_11630 [Amycolatopsis orientalis]